MRPAAARSRDAGVTLVELLVAMAIFAVIGVAGLTILDTVLKVNARTEGRLERLAEIDRALLVIRRDLAQTRAGALTLDADGLRLRREADPDPVGIRYALTEGQMLREIDSGGAAPVAQVLLGDVTDAAWRVTGGGQGWLTGWPPQDGAPGLPLAAELSLTVILPSEATPTTLTRLMPLPAGVRQ
ncbi:prepilin-type N-terminal cleavage/methylation domain-containing protein [Thalassococcus sp. BH17M4-6]|uniref:prepilin-type N-terminal cleavage/methylation domain-containing protein n=1 Tax=Thalassococcus sp. BH17M4-6 TaxID=3413148 RepID=UPI003BBEBAB7